jgi:hypothetical protein
MTAPVDELQALREQVARLETQVAELRAASSGRLTYTRKEAAAALGVGVKKVDALRKAGEIDGHLWGGIWVYPRASVDSWPTRVTQGAAA